MKALVLCLWIALAVLCFDVSAGLMMASGACFAAWLDTIRARGKQ